MEINGFSDPPEYGYRLRSSTWMTLRNTADSGTVALGTAVSNAMIKARLVTHSSSVDTREVGRQQDGQGYPIDAGNRRPYNLNRRVHYVPNVEDEIFSRQRVDHHVPVPGDFSNKRQAMLDRSIKRAQEAGRRSTRWDFIDGVAICVTQRKPEPLRKPPAAPRPGKPFHRRNEIGARIGLPSARPARIGDSDLAAE